MKLYEIIWNPVLFDSGLVLQGKRSGTVYWVYCLLPLLPLVRHRFTPPCHVSIDHRLPSHPSHPSQVQWCQEDSAVVWSSNETTGSCDFAGTNITGKGKQGKPRENPKIMPQWQQPVVSPFHACDKPDLCSSCVPSCVPGIDKVKANPLPRGT